MAKKLYVIDGHYQIFRAYYAPFRDLTSPSGEPTRATYVFSTWLLKLLTEHKPDYLAIAADSRREELERTQVYPEYKAQREAPPEDFEIQMERIFEIVRAMGIPVLARVGAEADDIMATVAARLGAQDVDIVLVTRDKDLEQVITPNVLMFDPIKGEMIGPKRLVELKGYSPDQAVEIQTLCGDKVDNIPGAAGIGPKTAAKLIAQYGTAEEVIAHADEQSPKRRENLLLHAENIALTRQLVTLDKDVDIDVELEDLAFGAIRFDALRPIFTELGFGRLVKRLDELAGGDADTPVDRDGVEDNSAPLESAMTTAADFDYECIDTPEALDALVADLTGCERLAIDTETTSTQPMWADLVGISLAYKAGHAVYIPLAGPLGAKTLDVDLVREKLTPILTDAKIEKIGQNLKYDLIVLRRAGFDLAGPMFDTMLAAYVLSAGLGGLGLDRLAAEWLGHRCIPISEVIGTGRNRRTMNEVPVEEVVTYAAEDADVTFRLAEKLRTKLEAEQGLTELFERIEMALMPVIAGMETAGVRVDPSELGRQKVELSKKADELRDGIIKAVGREFNVDSPKQLGVVLFEDLQLPIIKRTKTGPSTDSSVLTALASKHPVPAMVLDYRQVSKLLGTYLEGLGKRIHPTTGRVHTSFHQAGTSTGRLSSSDPNLQNIPIRTEMGRAIRSAFVAEEGNVLLAADYSQVELRILAHLCRDETLLAAFHADQDIHRTVAAEVFGVAVEDVTGEQRSRAKTVNFGIIYGQTAFGLAATLRIPRGEAQEFITSYKNRFPKIDEFVEACATKARKDGYVETLAGRRRHIGGLDSSDANRRAAAERTAINSVVQGSAADLIKIAMVNLSRRLADEDRPSRMLLQIHDELVFETPAESAQEEGRVIVEEMAGAMTLDVPLKVDLGIGANWRDAK